MVRSTLVIVCDDQATVQKAEAFGQANGFVCQLMTTHEWEAKQTASAEMPALVSGGSAFGGGLESGKVLPFPGVNFSGGATDPKKSVSTINQLENVAIENAISAYKGNLTEAAKALGIGRATLYRKVKQYNIDPAAVRTSARKKKAA